MSIHLDPALAPNSIDNNPPHTPEPAITPSKDEEDVDGTRGSTRAASPRVKKLANYREPEDVQLCHSWLGVSEDPKTGSSRHGTRFWDRVTELYHKEIPRPVRTAKSLESRWAMLQKSVGPFGALYEEAQRARESSGSSAGQEDAALMQAFRQFAEDQGRRFKYFSCYTILAKSPTWTSYAASHRLKKADAQARKKRKRTPSSELPPPTSATSEPQSDDDQLDDEQDDPHPADDLPQRLTDHPPQEEPGPESLTACDDWKTAIANAQVQIAAQMKRQNDLLQVHAKLLQHLALASETTSQAAIMTRDLSGLDNDTRSWFVTKRKQILASLNCEESSTSASSSS
ncbi:hypothetical protein PCANC_28501 [Puccinia coronata f. sp. avenae]|uniref:No apical meristem-associated C-terminal domain-containing protein n=1 Tax=Puccinia coronata f. sp. avenae TaxID=200324 RepID=A0A2N5TH20_9BASI|nr:hypothetical protein PCANC_28501 [Puccinia coronata f. sp. avenae]